jgi:hypothetical protein
MVDLVAYLYLYICLQDDLSAKADTGSVTFTFKGCAMMGKLGAPIRAGSTGVFLTWAGTSDSSCALMFNNDGVITYNVILDNQQSLDIFQDYIKVGDVVYGPTSFVAGQQISSQCR